MRELPESLKGCAAECNDCGSEDCRGCKLAEALSIAWEALAIGNEIDCECGNSGECAKHYLVDAMKRIEELGRGNE